MEIILDGKRCDLTEKRITIPSFDTQTQTDIAGGREGRSLKVSLPTTSRNDALLLDARDPQAAARFNAALHRAEVRAEGAVLFAGTVRLLASGDEGHTIEIREGGAKWARYAARKGLNQLPIDYRIRLTPSFICAGWSDSTPVKFLPIRRDEYPRQNSPTDLLPAERLLSTDDYHPFLSIATMLKSIFSTAGYRIQSRFLDSEFFCSLYMSGAYASRDTTAQRNRMDFRARRLGPATATANEFGQVFANPFAIHNTVGNIVDTATPQSLDADGEVIAELSNNGGCFFVEGKRIGFRPPTEVSVGFEYYLKYTTDHRILTRDRLAGFDSIWFGPGSDASFALANRYKDRRAAITTNFAYRVVVFGHKFGAQYRLIYTRNGVAGAIWASFSARTAQVTTPAGGTVAAPKLQHLTNGVWVDYIDDWALYDGYITETGRTTVEVRIRTVSESAGPPSPKFFDTIYFYGAEAGMSITLDKSCSLRPHFTSSPGYNALVTFADVARHGVRQSALLEAIEHLFNLRFYTEEATKTVYIEPADDFYAARPVADWRSKSDFSQPVIVADIAPEVHQTRTWSYLDGDGAVARLDAASASPFGEWTAQTDSYAAKEGEKRLRNPLFCPTINSTEHYANAPSAWLMQVGDRDAAQDDGSNFTPRIVRFCGLHPLPEGERWGYPTGQGVYPLAAFHFPGDAAQAGFTLCFEDRDTIQGLHSYYDRQTTQESTCQRITISLRIAPHEYESLFSPGLGVPDVRTVFLLDTGQGSVRATLHTIDEYDPEAASVRCTFTRQIED